MNTASAETVSPEVKSRANAQRRRDHTLSQEGILLQQEGLLQLK